MTLEKNAMRRSTPSIFCDKTAPRATSEASVSRIHGSWGSGKAREVASTKAFLRASNACEWFRYGRKPFYEATIVRGQAEKRTYIAQTMGRWPVSYRFQLIRQWVDSINTCHVAQKLNFRLEQFTLGWLGFKSYVPKTIKDDS